MESKVKFDNIIVMNELLLEKYAYKKKKPVLLPYIDNIRILLEHDATQKSILDYLKNEEGITVSQPYLSKFIRQYIYGDKQPNGTKKGSIAQPVEESQKSQTPKIVNSNSISNSTSNDKDTPKEMNKSERDALIEELLKNNQNYLQKSKRGGIL